MTDQHPPHILFLVDDPMVCDAARPLLELAGLQVAELSLAQVDPANSALPVDLVLIDLRHLDALSAVASLREAGKRYPVLALAGIALTPQLQRRIRDLDISLMPKPFGPLALLRRIRLLLGSTEQS